MALNCPKCGTPLTESAEFCPSCGAATYTNAPGKPASATGTHKSEHHQTAEYWLNVKCNNCNYTNRISIALVIPANGYTCPNCQCVGFLHRAEDARS